MLHRALHSYKHYHVLDKRTREFCHRFFRAVLFFAVATATVSGQTTQSSIKEPDTLGSRFNLGRVSGLQTKDNTLFSYYTPGNRQLAFADVFKGAAGNSRINVQYSLVSLIGTVDMAPRYRNAFLLYTSMPHFGLNIAPSPGNRILLQLNFLQIGFGGVDGEFSHEFHDNVDFSTRFRWDALSGKGTIRVTPEQYETAFYLGPQLNAGRVKFTLDCAPIQTVDAWDDRLNFEDITQSDEITDKNNIGAQFHEMELSVGLTNTLTLKGNAHYFDSTGMREPYLADYRFTTSAGLEYRVGSVVVDGGVMWAAGPEDFAWMAQRYGPEANHIFADATVIFGSRITSLRQVNGNFDRYFSPTMGPGQLLLHIAPDFVTSTYSGIDTTVQSTTLEYEIRYGATSVLTVGQQGKFGFGKFEYNEDPWKKNTFRNLSIDFTLSNIPLRTSGPETVSSFEYRYGYWPRTGEFRVDGYLQLPLFDLWGNRWIVDSMETDAYLKGAYYKMKTPFESAVANKRFLLNDPVLRCALVCGINPTTIFSNEFCFKTIRRSSPEWTWLRSATPMVEDLSYTYDYSVWANQFRFHFGDPATHLHAVGLIVAGQTDRAIRKDSRTECIFSYQFTSGI